MSVRITAEWTICVVNGVSHTAFLLEVFVFRDAQLWAHCQVSNLEDPQKFEKCERTVFRTQSRGV